MYKFLFFILLSNVLWAGDKAGTGGDNPSPDKGAAWFLSDRVIKYCIEVSPDFGVSKDFVSQTVEQVFKTWRGYIQEKKVNDPVYVDSSYNQVSSTLKIVANSEEIPVCDGNQDLTFYMGIENAKVKQGRAEYESPTAFSYRVSYDATNGWGKGFVWVAPAGRLGVGEVNWTLPYRLEGILLHEIGHLLGNTHLSETIMDKNLGQWVTLPSIDATEARRRFTSIDDGKELFFCWKCPFEYKGTNRLNGPKITDELFLKLIGRKKQGVVEAHLIDKKSSWFLPQTKFLVKDSVGEITLNVETSYAHLAMHFGEVPVFTKAIALPGYPKSVLAYSLQSDAVTYLGKIIAYDGKKYPVLINRNMDISRMTMALLNDYEIVDYIFEAESSRSN